jgi:hypothetical protein
LIFEAKPASLNALQYRLYRFESLYGTVGDDPNLFGMSFSITTRQTRNGGADISPGLVVGPVDVREFGSKVVNVVYVVVEKRDCAKWALHRVTVGDPYCVHWVYCLCFTYTDLVSAAREFTLALPFVCHNDRLCLRSAGREH